MIPSHDHSIDRWQHDHSFDQPDSRAERRVNIVLGLTIATMVAEIVAGLAFNSMALLADGIHMGTHAGALGIAAFAYRYARAHHQNPQFSFGTGKVASLAGFASAVLLAVIALATAAEALSRLVNPSAINYQAALGVAVFGLVVNLASAALLGHGHDDHHGHHDHHGPDHQGPDHQGPDHHEGHGHEDQHDHAPHGHGDHNLRAAYVHVLADAATSVLAIAALIGGSWLGWSRLDPVVALVGCGVIGSWAWGLVRDTSAVLLDRTRSLSIHDDIRKAIESDGDSEVADLHIWRVGIRAHVVVLTVVTHLGHTPDHYKGRISHMADLDHVTVEVNRCVTEEIGVGRA